MKIGWIFNAAMRDKSDSQRSRFIDSVMKAKLNTLIIGGNFSGQGYDLMESYKIFFKDKGIQLFYLFASKDFKNNDVTMADFTNSFEEIGEKNGFSRLSRRLLTHKDVAVIGADGWYDGLGLSKDFFTNDFSDIVEFNKLPSLEEKIEYCSQIAKISAENLVINLEEAYKGKPKKIFIFTPYPISDLSMDFGGRNIVPADYRGAYINRNMMQSIQKLIASHKSTRHILFAGSPLGNNSNMLAPNFKEFLCTNSFRNKAGQKDVAIHTLSL